MRERGGGGGARGVSERERLDAVCIFLFMPCCTERETETERDRDRERERVYRCSLYLSRSCLVAHGSVAQFVNLDLVFLFNVTHEPYTLESWATHVSS